MNDRVMINISFDGIDFVPIFIPDVLYDDFINAWLNGEECYVIRHETKKNLPNKEHVYITNSKEYIKLSAIKRIKT